MKKLNLNYTHDRRNKGGFASVELRINYDNKSSYISTGINIEKKNWDAARQEVKGLWDIAVQEKMNRTLMRLRSDATDIYMALRESNKEITAAEIRRRVVCKMEGKDIDDGNFIEWLTQQIEQEKEVAALAHETIRHHVNFLHRFSEWGKIVRFSDVTKDNVLAMEAWLRSEGKTDETVCGYHRILRKFVRMAVGEGKIKDNPYDQVKIKRGTPKSDAYLTVEDFEKIKGLDVDGSLEKVRDMFVFQCLTGLSYIDMMEFDPGRIRTLGERKVYSARRQKTAVAYTTILLDDALAVIAKYDGVPKMTNQQYNLRLKVLATAAKIKRPITSHWARHTAAMMWLNKGVPVEIVSRMLGHSNVKITQAVYAHILDQTIVDAFDKADL
jgi:site-specific recombinase XerD